MSGWVFIVAGLVLIGMGSFSIYYGQDILRKTTLPAPTTTTSRTEQIPSLNPQQQRLLSIIHEHQVQLGARKLIVGRGQPGVLYFDEPERKNININIAEELFGEGGDLTLRVSEFEVLMEGIPPEYLRMIPEARMDNPFVVTVTEAGTKYLKRH